MTFSDINRNRTTTVEKILKLSKTFHNSLKDHRNPMDIENYEKTFKKLSKESKKRKKQEKRGKKQNKRNLTKLMIP